MIKKILIIFAVLVAGLLIAIFMQPDTYQVTRAQKINAPPAAVFALVNDYRRWDDWSPWAKLDPGMKTEISGPEGGGVGATYSWKGNSDVGSGKMTTLAVEPGKSVKIDLSFIEPFASSSITTFRFEPDGENTQVNWEMAGEANFLSKAMCLFMSMDAMIGPDFEKGLQKMKEVAEAAPAQP
jgi:uncharacterized protein YndB with AHSA1/START domain